MLKTLLLKKEKYQVCVENKTRLIFESCFLVFSVSFGEERNYVRKKNMSVFSFPEITSAFVIYTFPSSFMNMALLFLSFLTCCRDNEIKEQTAL